MKSASPIPSKLEKRGLISTLTLGHSPIVHLEKEKEKPTKPISKRRIDEESLTWRTLNPAYPEKPSRCVYGKRRVTPNYADDSQDSRSTSADLAVKSPNPQCKTSREHPFSGEAVKIEEDYKSIRSQKYLESQVIGLPGSRVKCYTPPPSNKMPRTISSIENLPGSFLVPPEDPQKTQKKLSPLKHETTMFNPVIEKPLKQSITLEQSFDISGRF
ncbi:unnamed protein product [Blepharisma stoltei]|uniref:Uncharacterized protein n=1 Tax=Blepharisma stoltei TaxID=1481888 RepID=A0AAU9IG09_9CILI|nr:unnamed protein product [Blepharisma stoltei]